MRPGFRQAADPGGQQGAVYLADQAVLLGRGGALTGAAADLLTDTALSALYEVPVRTVTYSDGGHDRRAVVVHYGDGSGDSGT